VLYRRYAVAVEREVRSKLLVWTLAHLEVEAVVAIVCGECYAGTKLVASDVVPELRAEVKIHRCAVVLETTDHRFGDWEVVSGNVIIPPIVKEQRCIYCGHTETVKDWGYVWVTVLAGIAAIGVCFGLVAYFKAYQKP
jgi:hypothetical protein